MRGEIYGKLLSVLEDFTKECPSMDAATIFGLSIWLQKKAAQDSGLAIQQGALADLPAMEGWRIKLENALSTWKQFNDVELGTASLFQDFGEYCQDRLTRLAGR